jgi:hypothetical protein
MKISIFWDITKYSPLKVNWHFGDTYRLHLQGRRNSLAGNQRESAWQALVSCSANSSNSTYTVLWATCYIALAGRQKTESLVLRHTGYHVIATHCCVTSPAHALFIHYPRADTKQSLALLFRHPTGVPRDRYPGSPWSAGRCPATRYKHSSHSRPAMR